MTKRMKFARSFHSLYDMIDAAAGKTDSAIRHEVANLRKRYPDVVWGAAGRNYFRISRILRIREFNDFFVVLVSHQESGRRKNGNPYADEWVQVECFSKCPTSTFYQSEKISTHERESWHGGSRGWHPWHQRFDIIVSARKKKDTIVVRLCNPRMPPAYKPNHYGRAVCKETKSEKLRTSFYSDPTLKIMIADRRAEKRRLR